MIPPRATTYYYCTHLLSFQEQCAQYWPQSKNSPEKVGSQLSVEMLSEGGFEDYICRELKITDLTVSPQMVYRHFAKCTSVLEWPKFVHYVVIAALVASR